MTRMNPRNFAALVIKQERARVALRADPNRCSSCGRPVYPAGSYMICRNLSCKQLVER